MHKRNLVFFDTTHSLHVDRILSEFEKIEWEVEYRNYNQGPVEPHKILFFGHVDSIPKHLLDVKNPKIGISWAYDIYSHINNTIRMECLLNSFEKLDLLVVDCEYVAGIAKKIGMDANKILILPYGVSLEDYSYKKIKRRRKKIFNIYSNRNWEVGYGQSTLLEAIKRLVENQIEVALHLSGDGRTRVELLNKYRQLIESGVVIYHGRVTPKKNRTLLINADVYVSASEYDGWSVSILESLAVGTPVIAADIEPNVDLLDSGKNGILFENRNPNSLYSQLESFIDDPNDTRNVEAFRMSGREKVEVSCNFESNVLDLSRLLQTKFLSLKDSSGFY